MSYIWFTHYFQESDYRDQIWSNHGSDVANFESSLLLIQHYADLILYNNNQLHPIANQLFECIKWIADVDPASSTFLQIAKITTSRRLGFWIPHVGWSHSFSPHWVGEGTAGPNRGLAQECCPTGAVWNTRSGRVVCSMREVDVAQVSRYYLT